MTSIHPSRSGLVPPPVSASLPSRPDPGPSSIPEPSREELLRQKLLSRRSRGEVGSSLSLGIKGAASSGASAQDNGAPIGERDARAGDISGRQTTLRGKELLDSPDDTDGRLRRAADSGRRSSRRSSPALGDSHRFEGTTIDQDEPRERRRRSYSREGEEVSRQTDDRRNGHGRELIRDERSSMDRTIPQRSRDDRSPLPRERDDRDGRGEAQRDYNDRRSINDDRYSRPENRRDERDVHRQDRRGDRDESRSTPSYRQHDIPPHLPARPTPMGSGYTGPPVNNGHTLPPIRMGMQPAQPMPPFPPSHHAMPPFPPGQSGAMPPFPPNGPSFPPQNRNRNAPQGFMNLEQRREEREKMTLSVWPPSPERPYQDPEEIEEERRAKRKERKKARKSKRRAKYSSSDTESSDSEYERRRRRRREKERRRKYSDEDGEVELRKRRKRDSRSKSAMASDVDTEAEAEWVEKGGKSASRVREPTQMEDDEEVGPRLPSDLSARDLRYKTHFKDMLYGEAEAMAAYAADGRRIPRRGEIGLDSDRIEKYEEAGYVMSGSRHKRMTAVRLRKENQVINAEEKRAILKLQREEKMRKEGAIVSQFREMLDEKLREGKAET